MVMALVLVQVLVQERNNSRQAHFGFRRLIQGVVAVGGDPSPTGVSVMEVDVIRINNKNPTPL